MTFSPSEELPHAPQGHVVAQWWPGDPGAPGGKRNRVGFRYEAYVPGLISTWDPILPGSLVADLARAEEAVRELDRHGPLLASLAWPLLRTEAIASSRIEGLSVSHHRLALAEHTDAHDPLANGVLGNVAALQRALDLASREIDTGILNEVHQVLLAGSAHADRAGRVRTEQNWIGGRHDNPRGAAFVPPPPDDVPGLLDDLVAFCRREDVPTLAQAAIAHVQFETIHPYFDGNGRVGRALIHVLFRRRRLAVQVLPPVSLVLGGATDRYISGLTAFRHGDLQAWLAFFADVVFSASRIGEQLAEDVHDLQQWWMDAAGVPRRGSSAAALIAALPGIPVVNLAAARAITGSSVRNTLQALDRLTDAGVLRERTGRRRGRIWECVGLFALLDGLEAQLREPRRLRRLRTDTPT